MPKSLHGHSSRRRNGTRRSNRVERLEQRQLLAADLATIQPALQGSLFGAIQSELSDQVFSAPIPLTGSQLQSSHSFVQNVGADVADFEPATTDIAGIKAELEQELGGKLGVGGVTVIGNDGDSDIRFQIDLQQTETFVHDVDFALGDNGILQAKLGHQGKLTTTLTWNWDLVIGVVEAGGISTFFVDTSSDSELSADVMSIIDASFADVRGIAGVFGANMSVDTNEGPSQFVGNYSIDLQDGSLASDNFLTVAEIPDLVIDGTLDGSGVAHLDIDAEFFPDDASVGGGADLFNLAVSSDAQIRYEFYQAPTDIYDDVTGDRFRTFGENELITFANLELDLGKFFEDFVNPIVIGVQRALEPLQEVISFLNDPLPVISDLSERNGGDKINMITIAKISAPDTGTLKVIEKAEAAITFIDRILKYVPPGSGDLSETTAGMGTITYERSKPKFLVRELQEQPPQTRDERNASQRDVYKTKYKEIDDLKATDLPTGLQRDFLVDFSGDLQLPILTDPSNLESLLLGDNSPELFKFGTDFSIGADFSQFVPIFPGLLSANLGFEFLLSGDVDLGYDGLGIDRLNQVLDFTDQATLTSSYEDFSYFLQDGFYFDDHNSSTTVEGSNVSITGANGTEGPELALTAGLSAGAEIGLDLFVFTATADLEGTLSANILLDFNDLPNPLPQDQWTIPHIPEYPSNSADWTYDGRVRMSELNLISDADPKGIVNSSGEFVAALSAGIKATAGVGPFQATIYDKRWTLAEEVLFQFDIFQLSDAQVLSGVKLNPPKIADFSDGVLTLRSGAGHGRENTNATRDGSDNVIDERFSITSLGPTDPNDPSLGETLVVTFSDGSSSPDSSIFARETYHNVTRITGNSGAGHDTVVIADSVAADFDFIAGIGNDILIYEGSGVATLSGDDGDDLLVGGQGNDWLFGGAGNDEMIGGAGADVLQAGPGNDMLDGGFDGVDTPQNDSLNGGDGNDVYALQVGGGSDVLIDNSGTDEITMLGGSTVISAGLSDEIVVVVPQDDEIQLGDFGSGLQIISPVETINLTGIEKVTISPGDGNDTVTIENLNDASLTDLTVDLSQTGGANNANDTVIYQGSDLGDTINVQASTATISDGSTAANQNLVQITDATASKDIYVINTNPDLDRLVLRGEGGNDSLSILQANGSDGASVLDLIDVSIQGGDGDDELRTLLVDVDLDGGPGQDSLQIDGATAIDTPGITIGSQRVVTIDSATGDVGSLVAFTGIEAMSLELDDKVAGNHVTVLSTIENATSPIRIVDGPGTNAQGHDQIFIEAVHSPVSVELLSGSNTVTVTKDGSLGLINQPIDIGGGDGSDRVVLDNRGNTAGQPNLQIDRYQVNNVGTPATVTYDDSVEEIELRLGSGDDTVQFGTGDPLPAGLNRKAIVDGGGGEDNFDFSLSGAEANGISELLRSSTTNVEHVALESQMSAAKTWLLDNGQLRTGTTSGFVPNTAPADYPHLVIDSPDADAFDFSIPSSTGFELFHVASVIQPTAIDVGLGDEILWIGSSTNPTSDVAAPLHIASASYVVLDDRASTLDRSGAIASDSINGFGLAGEITLENVQDFLFYGGDQDYDVSIDDTPANLQLNFGTGADKVQLLNNSHTTTVNLNGASEVGRTDEVTVVSASVQVNLNAAAEGNSLLTFAPDAGAVVGQVAGLSSQGRLEFPGIAPGVSFRNFDQVDVVTGDSNDDITLDYATPVPLLQVLSGGGDDRLTVIQTGGPVDFDHDGGVDRLVAKMQAPDANALQNVSFAPGLERLVIDNSAHSQSVDWIVDGDQLLAGANEVVVAELSNSVDANVQIIGGTAYDTLTIRETSSEPIDVRIDADQVQVIGGEVVLRPGTFLNDEIQLERGFGFSQHAGEVNRAANGVAAGDLDGDGDNDVFLARNGANRLLINNGNSDLTSHLLTDSNQELGAANSNRVELGDLDGDGDLDAVVTNTDAPSRVWINQGGFQAGVQGEFKATSQLLSLGESLAMADVNDDGLLDFVLVGDSNEVWINQGRPFDLSDVVFAMNSIALGTFGNEVQLGDMNNDGHLDAVIAGDTNSAIWLGDGSGDFVVPTGQLVFDADGDRLLALHDMDADGDLDIISAGDDTITRWENRLIHPGQANQTSPELLVTATHPILSYATGIEIGPIGPGGALRAFVSIYNTQEPVTGPLPYHKVLGLDGDGLTLETEIHEPAIWDGPATFNHDITLTDINGDGQMDVFFANSGYTHSYFRSPTPVPISDHGQSLPWWRLAPAVNSVAPQTSVAGDIDNDGDVDLLIGGGSVSQVWVNQGGKQNGLLGDFIHDGQILRNDLDVSGDVRLHLADVDNDQDLDVIAMGFGEVEFGFEIYDTDSKIWLNEGGTFVPSLTREFIDGVTSEVGDLDNDGDIDIFIGGPISEVFENQGVDGWKRDFVWELATNTLAIGDLDNDGDADLLLGRDDTHGSVPGQVILMNPSGPGDFQSYETSDIPGTSTSNTTDVELADLDGNGFLDVVIGSKNGDNRVFLNNGLNPTGTAIDWIDAGVLGNSDVGVIQITDVNVDGMLDIIFSVPGHDSEIWLTEGFSGTNQWLGTTELIQSTGSTSTLLAFDAEGDTDPDLFLGFDNGGEIRNEILLNRTVLPTDITQFVDTNQALWTDGFANAVELFDVDGDGDDDAFMLENGANRIMISQSGPSPELVDSGQLLGSSNSTDVAWSDLDGDGDLDAFVANRTGIIDNQNTVWLNSSGQFLKSQSLGTSESNAVALADLNGDSHLDAFVANDGANTVWLGDALGRFTASLQSLGSDATNDVALADLDGDGDIDAYVVNDNEQGTVWINDGAAAFTELAIAVGPTDNLSVSLGDFDQDNDVDAIVMSRHGRTQILENVSTGGVISFSVGDVWSAGLDRSAAPSSPDTGYRVVDQIRLGDPDDDGDLDIVMIGEWINHFYFDEYDPETGELIYEEWLIETQPLVQTLINNSQGQFSRVDENMTLVGSYSQGPSFALGDINGDAKLDFVSVHENGTSGTTGVNVPDTTIGNGFFEPFRQTFSHPESVDVELGDLDGDSDIDAFIATDGPTDQVWLNDGNGYFSDTFQPLGTDSATSVALGDIDRDGDLDAFVGNDGNEGLNRFFNGHIIPGYQDDTLWINDGNGNFTKDPFAEFDRHDTKDVALADVDGDGNLELIAINTGLSIDSPAKGEPIAVFERDPTTGSITKKPFEGPGGLFYKAGTQFADDVRLFLEDAHSLELADTDGDGDLDYVVSTLGSIVVLTNKGDGTVSEIGDSPGANATDLRLADLNRDGQVEIFTATQSGSAITNGGNRVLEIIDPSGAFYSDDGQRLGPLADVGASGVALADVDADGDLDAFVSSQFGSPNQLFINAGRRIGGDHGTFVQNGLQLNANSSTDVELADLDGDGDVDAFVTNLNGNNQVLFNSKIQSGITTLQSVTFSPDGAYVYGVDPNKGAAVVLSVIEESVEYPNGGFNIDQVLSSSSAGYEYLANASKLAFSADGNRVFIASNDQSSIATYDRNVDGTLAPHNTTINDSFTDVTDIIATNEDDGIYDGDLDHDVYVATGDIGKVIKLGEGIVGALPVEVSLGGNIAAVALSPDHTRVYAIDSENATLHVLDRNLNSLGSMLVASGAHALTVAESSVDVGADLIYINGSDDTLSVIRRDSVNINSSSGTMTLIQTLRDGLDGTRGLAGQNAIISSSVQSADRVYVTSSVSHSLAIFKHDPATDNLFMVQFMRNGNSNTLGLLRPNSLTIRDDGAVVIGSTAGKGLERGGAASFLTPAGGIQTASLTVSYENIEKLAVQTGVGNDNVAVVAAPSVDLSIDAGDGNNTIDLFAGSAVTTVTTGAGRDLIDLRSSNANTSFFVDTGDGPDRVTISRTGDNGTIDVQTGAGDDRVIAAGSNLAATGSIVVRGGLGNDRLEFDSAGLATDPADRTATVPNGTISAVEHGAIRYEEFPNASIATPPIVSLNGPYVINEGDSITLDASASILNSDSGTFRWDLDGDGEFDEVTSETITLTFDDLKLIGLDDSGVYNIAVRVTNDRDQSSDAFSTITIADVQPTISASGAASVLAGNEYTLDLSSVDPGDDAIVQWNIDWGDGEASLVSGDIQQPTHTYTNTGTFNIAVTARDEDNPAPEPTYSTTASVNVTAPVPETGGPYVINEGEILMLAGASPGDPDFHWAVGTSAVTAPLTRDRIITWAELLSLGVTETGANIDLATTYAGGGGASSTTSMQIENVAPTADFSSNATVFDEGDAVMVTFANASDPSPWDVSAGFTYSYDFDNDGTFDLSNVTEPSASFIADHAGSQVIRGQIADKDGGTREYLISITVAEVEPTLIVTSSSSVDEGQSYMLELSATDPGDDSITEWLIDWGDGTSSSSTQSNATLTHNFADDGTFVLRITAVDSDGVYTTEKTVTVNNVAPTLALATSMSTDEGDLFTLELIASDPGDDVLTQWVVNWGDGLVETIGGSSTSVTHQFLDNGDYLVSATAMDEDASTAYVIAPLSVSVANVAPSVSFDGTGTVDEGSVYALSLSAPVDPGNDTATTFTIDWGDGSATESHAVPAADSGGFVPALNVTHTYLDSAASYTVTVNTTDEDGTFLNSEDHIVQVNNVAPQIDLLGSSRATVGNAYQLTLGDITDPGVDTVSGYEVDWGDGSTAQTFTSAGQISHVFANVGDFVIAVAVIDEDGTHLQAGTRQVTVSADTVAPTLLDFIIADSSWPTDDALTPDFVDTIDGGAIGEGNGLGISLIEENSTILPWQELDRIYLVFSEDVGTFSALDFSLTGVGTDEFGPVGNYAGLVESVSYAVAPSSFGAGTFMAQIALSTPIGQSGVITRGDRLLFALASSISDLANNQLGELSIRFDVLPGDVDGDGFVLGSDILAINQLQGTFAPLMGFEDPNYDTFKDVDGDGFILGSDMTLANSRQGDFLPFGEPLSPEFAQGSSSSSSASLPAPASSSSSSSFANASLVDDIFAMGADLSLSDWQSSEFDDSIYDQHARHGQYAQSSEPQAPFYTDVAKQWFEPTSASQDSSPTTVDYFEMYRLDPEDDKEQPDSASDATSFGEWLDEESWQHWQ